MKFAALLAAGLFTFSAMPVLADGIGTNVTGTLTIDVFNNNTNYFDPANGIADPSARNATQGTTVTIGNGVEFGTTDGKTTYRFDFTGSTLTFTNINNNGPGGGEGAVTFTFTDPVFTGFSLASNGAGVTYSYSGNTLTIKNPGGSLAGVSTFNYTSSTPVPPAVTPEPNSLLLLGTGALSAAGLVRRRIRR